MGWGILVGAELAGFISSGVPRTTLIQYVLMFSSGLLWSTGTLGYTYAVELIGLTRSTPIKNTTAIFATAYGIIIFHEFSANRPLPLAMVSLGSIAVVGAATLLGRASAPPDPDGPPPDSRRFMMGVIWSLWAAFAYSAYTIPMKVVYNQGVTPLGFLFYMGQGCFVGMELMALYASRKDGRGAATRRDKGLSLIAGFTWAVASVCANLAVVTIGIAITWPVSNLNTVVAVAYGVLVFKEIDVSAHRRELWAGLAMAVLGVVFLAVATF